MPTQTKAARLGTVAAFKTHYAGNFTTAASTLVVSAALFLLNPQWRSL
ncbi:MAG: hypothetical protein M3Q32_07960 [Pseudomonadota bacterium]|nr:hypothetical protein [Pseudomonadota bacterium]